MGKIAFAVGAGACALAFGCGLVLDINAGNPIGAAVEAGTSGGMDAASLPFDSGDPSCPSGQARCGGMCIDVATNATNCGRCDHDCVGGKCTAGVCEPVQIASGLNVPYGITAVGDEVFVTLNGEGGVVRIPKAGGAPQDAVQRWKTGKSGDIGNSVEAAGSFLVWVETGDGATLHTCQLPGCTNVSDWNEATSQSDLTIADGVAYFNQYHENAAPAPPKTMEVVRCTVANCGNDDGVTGNDPQWLSGIAVNGADLYYGVVDDHSYVRKTSTTGGQPSTFLENTPEPTSMTTDGQTLFVTSENGNAILKCPLAAGCNRKPESLFSPSPGHIVSDKTNVYWTSHGPNHSIMYCPAADCSATTTKTLAGGQFSPQDIAFDDKAVYWTNAIVNGQVMKVAKP